MSASTTSGTAATKGPWTFATCSGPEAARSAHIYAGVHTIVSWSKWHPSMEANARLIAAAPELYEFAAALDASWTAMIPSGPDGGDEFLDLAEEHKTLWRMCRAALSKANGEQA